MAESTDYDQLTEISGWLFKWKNYLRGYRKRWFVLSNGYLSYYRNQDEKDHSYCGSIYIYGATVYSKEPKTFSIVSNEESYHIKTTNETEKQTWVRALELAKLDQVENVNNAPLSGLTGRLRSKLQDLHTFQKILEYHDQDLQSSLSAIEVSSTLEIIVSKIQEVNERAAEFRTSTSALMEACSEYLDLAECKADKWLKLQQTGKQKRVWLVNVLALMRKLSLNKHKFNKGNNVSSTANEESMVSSYSTDMDPRPSWSGVTNGTVLMYPVFPRSNKSEHSKTTEKESSKPPDEDSKQASEASVRILGEGGRKTSKALKKKQDRSKKDVASYPDSLVRRTRIPNRPPCSMSLWNVVKNNVGKDISKMPVPVHFSEPLSFLQRLTEDFEYAHILDEASDLKDPAEQIAHVAGFAISSYSNTPYRITKPFNPLLGETYECDRNSDLGWKSIAEQVSHHPPISALHCEGKQWTCWLDQSVTTKFQGQNIFCIPSGDIHLRFNCGNHYVWNKVTSSLHNIIIGKMWIDQEGDMDIKCFTNGFSCRVSFISPGYFGGEPHKVKGVVFDKDGLPKRHIGGSYVSKIEVARIDGKGMSNIKHSIAHHHGEVIWTKKALVVGSDKYYNFTVFTCQLNEMEDGIAPTDSRNRPDQRSMENGQLEEAAKKKVEMEERQRIVKNGKEAKHIPVWFQKEKEPETQKEMYLYKGEYWPSKMSQNWSRCPAIF